MNLPYVVNSTAKQLHKYRKAIRRTFRPSPDQIRVLTPEEQVRRFLSLTMDDLENIRRQRGTTELMRYVLAQLENLKALRNAV